MTADASNSVSDQPEPVECPACGYDLSGTSSFTCSECGWESVPEDSTTAGFRHEFLALSPTTRYGWSALFLVPTIVVGFLIATRLWPVAVSARQWIGGSILLLAFGSAVFGLGVSSAVPIHRRPLIMRLWLADAGWLHMPFHAGWIVGLLFFPMSLLFPSSHPAFLVVQAIAALLFLLGWAWIAGFSYLAWHRRWNALTDDSWWRTAEPVRTIYLRGSAALFGINAVAGLILYWLVVAVLTS